MIEHRCPGAVPASAGALGGVPRGERAGPPGRPSRAGRGDRSAARSRSARMASRARRGASRRGRGRRAGALGRPRAQSPGGVAAAAAFLAARGRADPGPGPARPAGAGRRAGQVRVGGAGGRAGALAVAEMCPLDELQRARLALLRAQYRVRLRRAAPTLRRCCVDAARRLEALDPALARETYLEALGAAMYAGRLDADSGVLGGRGGPRRARGARPPRSIDLVLDGLATRCTEGPGRGRAAAQARARGVQRTRRSTVTRRSCAGSCCLRSSSR